MSVECKICGNTYSTDKGLSYHITHTHKITLEAYYLKYECNDPDSAGKCKVCGKPTPFISRLEGYQPTCCLSCGGKFSTIAGKQTMLIRYGKKSLNNIDKTKQFYAAHPEVWQSARNKTVATRKANGSYVTGGIKAFNTFHDKIAKFLKENDCVLVGDLCKQFGQGWYKAKADLLTIDDYVFTDQLGRGIKYCIKNSAIPKIQAYFDENKYNQSSHGEKEVLNFIKSIYSNKIIENSRGIISPYELDIYLPDINLAIEYNGTFWHSQQGGTEQDYHRLKAVLCTRVGIQLVSIFEFDWRDEHKQLIIKNLLKNLIQQTPTSEDAINDCTIDKLNTDEAINFFNNNCINYLPYSNNERYLGFYTDNRLIGGCNLINVSNNIYQCTRFFILDNSKIAIYLSLLRAYFNKVYVADRLELFVDLSNYALFLAAEAMTLEKIAEQVPYRLIVVRHPATDWEVVTKFKLSVVIDQNIDTELIDDLISEHKILTIPMAGYNKYILTASTI